MNSLQKKILTFIYSYLALPFVFLILFLLYFFLPKKLQMSLTEKFKSNPQPLKGPHILIHAASGEIEYAKPLIEQLLLTFPNHSLLITYSSPSLKKLFQNQERVTLAPLPFDFKFLIKMFLKKYDVKYILITRSDLWINLLLSAQELNIFTHLFSHTVPLGKQSFFSNLFKKMTYSLMSRVDCVDEDDKLEIIKLLPQAQNIFVLGDSRYDQVIKRLETNKKQSFIIKELVKSPTFIGGSLWPEDEAIIIPLLPDLIQAGYFIILVPHEPTYDHLFSLESTLKKQNLCYSFFSHLKNSDGLIDEKYKNTCKIIIVDEVGHLASLYSLGDVAFVGGSFKEKVHSVMEPLAFGLPVFVGPYFQNNREASLFKSIQYKHSLPAVMSISNENDLLQNLIKLKTAYTLELKNFIQNEVKKRSGTTTKLIQIIKNNIKEKN